MKKSFENLKGTGIILMATALFVSCSKESAPETTSNGDLMSVADLKLSDESEQISDDIVGIGEDVYAADEISFTSKASFTSNFLPDCVTITTVVSGADKEKAIDFGAGCELPNGNVLSGIVHLSYQKDMEMATKTVSLSLENFTFNGVAVEGSASVIRTRANDNGHPQSDVMASFSGQWPDGSTAGFTRNRTREWIEGYGTGFWGDNVFLITGKGTFTNKMGTV